MSERPAPETDAACEDIGMGCMMVAADFARKMERQRDEAREELAALKRTAHWLYSRLNLHLATDQFAGTTLRLERIGNDNPWLTEPYMP